MCKCLCVDNRTPPKRIPLVYFFLQIYMDIPIGRTCIMTVVTIMGSHQLTSPSASSIGASLASELVRITSSVVWTVDVNLRIRTSKRLLFTKTVPLLPIFVATHDIVKEQPKLVVTVNESPVTMTTLVFGTSQRYVAIGLAFAEQVMTSPGM